LSHNYKMVQIDEFVAESKKMQGKEVQERALWNTHVTGDAIRHFALGIGDDNPLWLDLEYSQKGPYGRPVAPPAFLTSVLYPILHGAPMTVPLWFLVGEVKYQWFRPILVGDRLWGTSKQIDLYDTKGSAEERRLFIISETCYWNQDDIVVGKATGTTVCVPEREDGLLIDRPIYEYTDEEMEKIGAALRGETHTGNRKLADKEIQVGKEIPTLVRGPLTIGDMVCWQAAIGPAYIAGSPGYLNLLKSPHSLVKNPVTRWPVNSTQQHEDFLMTSQRGMPWPFDNGVMRFAWLSAMITNWIGDNGFLTWFSVKVVAPNLYGDTTWYRGKISERTDLEESISLKLKVSGTNQLGEITTEAEAGVILPRQGTLTFHRSGAARDRAVEKKASCQETWAKDLFEDQAKKSPNAVALVFGDTKLTYEKVNQRANQLAENLVSLGVGPDVPVALCMDRSLNYIITVLGILKAGGTYVPLDPEYPQKRLAYMLKDCQAQMLIVDDAGTGDFFGYPGQVVSMGSILQNANSKGNKNTTRQTNKKDLAYIMYTSGSFGNPKGIAVTQGNLSSYLLALKESLDVNDNDIYLHTASFVFSASIRQVFLPLCAGATVVIADNEQRSNPIALSELICRAGVTIWDTVPRFLSLCCDTLMKLDSVKAKALLDNRLRRILVTGESLTWEVPHAWNRILKHNARIVNLYSQTETSGTVCKYEIPKDSASVSGPVPIGLPIHDAVICLLDENLRPVSYSEVGEICVAGPRIAEGYLNRPELTANQFISHPFSNETGSRIFKTGDLGCYLPDGNIVFKGRLDRRVKIRGFRIELEEVEGVLSTHPEIERAVVVTRDGRGGEPQLVAYFIPKGKITPKMGDLRAFLQSTVPDYMLPTLYVMLDEIPLTPSGKIAYHALPAPNKHSQPLPSLSETTYIDDFEEEITHIWQKVFGLSTIGRKENFFDMGGDSLMGVRLILEIEQALNQRIALATLYEYPTVAGLAGALREEGKSSKWKALVPVRPQGSNPPFFCVYAMASTLAPHLDPDIPFYWFNWLQHGKGDGLVSNYSVPDIAASHIEEIRSVQDKGPYFLGGFSFGGTVALEMALQLHAQGEHVALLALFDPFNPHRKIYGSKRIERLAAQMASIPTLGDKSRFLLKRIKNSLQSRTLRNLQRLASKYYMMKGKPLPPKLNVAHLLEMSHRATMAYEYRVYPGRITLFVPEYRYSSKELEDSALLGWRDLAVGGVSLYIVRGAIDHIDIVKEPCVSDLAGKLNACLREAQKSLDGLEN